VVSAITHEMFEGMRLDLLQLRQRWSELALGETLELTMLLPSPPE
jgi:hypothetical protein